MSAPEPGRGPAGHLWLPFTQMTELDRFPPLVIERGEGVYLYDTDGNQYIDGVSSLWCNVHGHRVKAIDDAVRAQLNRVAHTTMLGNLHPLALELGARLVELTPEGLDWVFYSDSGSEAVEVALKMAFQRERNRGRPRTAFLSFRNAYHGDTVGSVSVGGMDLFHASYKALLFDVLFAPSPYCYRCPMGKSPASCGRECLKEFKRIATRNAESIAAVIIEPLVQAAAGIIVQPEGFYAEVAATCRELGISLIADEVAVGFGRTGAMFASSREGVCPDFLAVAKGLTGGYLPLAATLTTHEVFKAFTGRPSEAKTFFHGHTYTGNPLGAAAALAGLDLFESAHVLEHVKGLAEGFARGLEAMRELPCVGDIRYIGLMGAIELVCDKVTKELFETDRRVGFQVACAARKRRVLIRPLGDVIVVMPPLAISLAELKTLLDAVAESIVEVMGQS